VEASVEEPETFRLAPAKLPVEVMLPTVVDPRVVEAREKRLVTMEVEAYSVVTYEVEESEVVALVVDAQSVVN
jgi:hypothetical protein